MVGRTLAHYKILDKRGSGGMGDVYLAEDTKLARELTFLANYDETKRAIQEIVDMPDRQLDLFIRFCLQNNGRLSARKREGDFSFLSDEEKNRMEEAVRSGLRNRLRGLCLAIEPATVSRSPFQALIWLPGLDSNQQPTD